MTKKNKTTNLQERWPEYTKPRKLGRIRTAYKVSKEDPMQIQPDFNIIPYFEEVFDLIESRACSWRGGTDWINERCVLSISHMTLRKVYERHRKPFSSVNMKAHPTALVNLKKAQKVSVAKNKFNKAQKEYEELKGIREKKADTPKSEPVNYDFDKIPSNVSIIFQPNEGPQTDFLAASETQVLYGGAAGGGKSYALLADPMRYFDNPAFSGLLVRKTNDELRELKMKSQLLYKKAFPGAVWREKDSTWKFPSGAQLWMSYLDRDEDVSRYQGLAFTWIGFDELTHWASSYVWDYLFSRLRSEDPELRKHLSMRATTNPGGVGHSWVKKMFVDPATPTEAFALLDSSGNPVVNKKTNLSLTRRFIPARLADNPYLAEGGEYEAGLSALPEAQRKKLLEGSWDVVEGAAFPEFNRDIHVVEPFEIPHNWRRFRSCDYGYRDHTCVLWYAIDPTTSQLVVYRELYINKITGKPLARLILSKETEERVDYGILDSSVWRLTGQTGPSVAEDMVAEGCRWRRADRGKGSRVNGKNRLHELLTVDEYDNTGLVFFPQCRQILTDLPMIPSDPRGGEDIDEKFKNDHTYDSLRYGIMSRPKPNPMDTWGTTSPAYTPSDSAFGY